MSVGIENIAEIIDKLNERVLILNKLRESYMNDLQEDVRYGFLKNLGHTSNLISKTVGSIEEINNTIHLLEVLIEQGDNDI